MNIAVIAPEKFQFQDIVCIEMALALRDSGPFSLVPEPIGGEDARISWSGTEARVLEVQVKGAKGTVTVADLVDYLTHYPERSSHASLLERLMDEEGVFASFVLSARCGDELIELLAQNNQIQKPVCRSATRQLATNVRNQVGQRATRLSEGELTALNRARALNQAELAKRPIDDFRRALSKVALVERETSETVEVRLHAILQHERFESNSIRGILARLSDVVAKSKRTQADVLPVLQNALAEYAPHQLRPSRYRDRGGEIALLERLLQDGCVMLAGPPRAGKSWTALAIASRLQSEGVEVRVGSHVDEAERYLSDGSDARRAYVLDDPLGAREPVDNPSARLSEISRLVAKLGSGRYLLVVQTEAVLLQVRAANDLAQCRLGRFSWDRLAYLSQDIAIEVWTAEAMEQGLSPTNIQKVVSLIERSESIRDPGALTYLAQTWAELPGSPTDPEIVAQARRDAVDFARSLSERYVGAAEILIATAIGTEVARPLAVQELAFIIGESHDRPAFRDEFEGSSFGGNERIPFPSYATEPTLSLEFSNTLATLQRRRVVFEQANAFNFSHPYLRAGAQALAEPDIPGDRARLLAALERALATPSATTSRVAAENLRWMRPIFQKTDLDDLFRLAMQGIQSRFPATRDSCFDFLLTSADQLPSSIRDQLTDVAESMIVSLDSIDTSGVAGFISRFYDFSPELPDIEEVTPYLDAIEEGRPIALDIGLSKRLLLALERDPSRLTSSAVMRFLRADEAIVRSEAAKLWVGLPRRDDGEILSLIAKDASPSMSAGLLESVGLAWSRLDPGRRSRLMAIIEDHCESPTCASVVYSRLVLFDRQEHFGPNPPWEMFARLIPKALSRLPLSIALRNGRLNSAIDSAMQKLPPDELGPALTAWAQRIVDKTSDYFLDEFELSVASPLLRMTSSGSRNDTLLRLLSIPCTGSRVVTFSSLVRAWPTMSTDDKTLVLGILDLHDDDRRWLAAAALTRRDVPSEIVEALTGRATLPEEDTKALEELLGYDLFAACMYVYCGWPQPLWWYATHHSGNAIWERAIVELAKSPSHPLQTLCLIETASHQSSSIVEVIEALPVHALPAAFQQLTTLQAATNSAWNTPMWRALTLRLFQVMPIEECTKFIDPLIEGIADGLRDVYLWLRETDLLEPVSQLVARDLRAIRAIERLEQSLGTVDSALSSDLSDRDLILRQATEKLCDAAAEAIERLDPRLHNTWSDVIEPIRRFGGSTESLTRLEEGRLRAVARHFAVRQARTGWPPEPVLEGWRDPRK